MKVDKIIKNAKIFTSDRKKPIATALAVRNGKFVYVGDGTGISAYEGEVTDLSGKFIMPGIIDSHVHVAMSILSEHLEASTPILCSNKKEALDFMAETVRNNPGQRRYRFVLERESLNDDDITKEDLDKICPENELIIMEEEAHSAWVNSRLLARHNVTDNTPDPVPGLSYFVRRDGHVTGSIFEFPLMRFLFDDIESLREEQIDAGITRWIDFALNNGVIGVFDAGTPEGNRFNEQVYTHLRDMDLQGRLPIYISGCYVISQPEQIQDAIQELRRMKTKFDTEHLKVHTLKIFMDGTLKIETAALVTPYEDTGAKGVTSFSRHQISELLKQLNDEGLDLHLHTVGEAASRTVLDGVEDARNELKDDYHVKVTCAHLEIQDEADLERFAKLGVVANYTPSWHAGNIGGNPYRTWCELLGEKRALSMYRCKTLWNTGALVTWSSDEVSFNDFTRWSPYLCMEVGMTRRISEKTQAYEWDITDEAFPSDSEKMNIEEMILGYTINGAKQLGIDAHKGSIEVGKDADFLVFNNDLLSAEHEGFSHNKPAEVYLGGKKI